MAIPPPRDNQRHLVIFDAVNEWAIEPFGDLLLIDDSDAFRILGELRIDNIGRT